MVYNRMSHDSRYHSIMSVNSGDSDKLDYRCQQDGERFEPEHHFLLVERFTVILQLL